jgi:hypothetical protein
MTNTSFFCRIAPEWEDHLDIFKGFMIAQGQRPVKAAENIDCYR